MSAVYLHLNLNISPAPLTCLRPELFESPLLQPCFTLLRSPEMTMEVVLGPHD